jgi:hypothetical protein
MKQFSASIGEHTVVVKCATAVATQAEWLLGLIERIEQQRGGGFIRDGVRIQVGWSVLTFVQRDNELIVCEPDFDNNPFRDARDDVTCTLTVQSQQNDVLRRVGVDGVPATFQEKVIFAKGCLEGNPRVYLERTAPTQGDSGWYVGPAGDPDKREELGAVFVYQVVRIRPPLLQALALPPGYLVVFNGDQLEAVLNPHNENVWAQPV